jgi:signal peptidase II
MPVLCLSFVVVLLDQLTKHIAHTRLDRVTGVSVVPGLLGFRYGQNTGAAWGILQGLNGWLVALSFLMLMVLIGFRRHFVAETRLSRVAAGMIVGGIVGNLIDRLRLGYVVDFIHVYWRSHVFPTFNVADSAICVGVGLFMIAQWRGERRRARGAIPAGEPGTP